MLTLAFVAGAVASVNPCGFALLPAFASFVLGERTQGGAPAPVGLRLWRAVRLAAVVTAAFVGVFAAAGLVFTYVSRQLVSVVPWVALGVGVALAGYGLLVAAGRGRLRLRLPNPVDGRGERRGGLLFGVGYAIASLSCTLPVFLTVVAGTLTARGLLAGVAGFVVYGAGMGTIVFAVAISMALARDGLVGRLRRAGRHVERLAGAVLAAAGGYLVVYWTYGLGPGRTPSLDSQALTPVQTVTGLAETAGRYLDTPAGRSALGVLALAVVAAIVAAAYVRRRQAMTAGGASDEPGGGRCQPEDDPSTDHRTDQECATCPPAAPAAEQTAAPGGG